MTRCLGRFSRNRGAFYSPTISYGWSWSDIGNKTGVAQRASASSPHFARSWRLAYDFHSLREVRSASGSGRAARRDRGRTACEEDSCGAASWCSRCRADRQRGIRSRLDRVRTRRRDPCVGPHSELAGAWIETPAPARIQLLQRADTQYGTTTADHNEATSANSPRTEEVAWRCPRSRAFSRPDRQGCPLLCFGAPLRGCAA